MDDVTLKIWPYISSYCLKVVQSLQNEVKTPTKIAEDTGIRTNHPSKVFYDLHNITATQCNLYVVVCPLLPLMLLQIH